MSVISARTRSVLLGSCLVLAGVQAPRTWNQCARALGGPWRSEGADVATPREAVGRLDEVLGRRSSAPPTAERPDRTMYCATGSALDVGASLLARAR